MQSESYETFTGVIHALQVVHRIGNRPRKPVSYGRIHIGNVHNEPVREVAVKVSRPEILIDVAVVLTTGQVSPRDNISRNGYRAAGV